MTTQAKQRPLTAKRLIFVRTYATNGHNGRQAALAAGVSEERATVTASEWLRVPEVVDAISVIDRSIETRTTVTAAKVLERAWQVANTDAKDRAAHLRIAADAFSEFKGTALVDNRTVNLLTLTDEQLARLTDGH